MFNTNNTYMVISCIILLCMADVKKGLNTSLCFHVQLLRVEERSKSGKLEEPKLDVKVRVICGMPDEM